MDGVIAQGSEAGTHRGTFAAPFEMAMVGTMALVPQIVDAVPGLPVVSLWAGQGDGLARRLPAADLVRRLVSEVEAARRALG